jgi:quinoprotein glucose dehydrogenase
MARVSVMMLGLCLLIGGTVVAQRSTITPEATEWRYHGADRAASKYSPLDQINRNNIDRLDIAWRWQTPDNALVRSTTARPRTYSDTPLMVNGVLYTITALGVRAAVDPIRGTTIWTYDPGEWKSGLFPANMGYNKRGVAYWSDGTRRRILSGTYDGHLLSLDAETGQPDPAFGANGRVDVVTGTPYAESIQRVTNYAINNAPVIVRDVVIAGANIDDVRSMQGPRGDVSGFDVRTGKKLWTFHTVPVKGEFGYDTWEGGAAERSGHTNVWGFMTADDELGYVYLPIGTPTNDFYGGARLGDNLFAESLVCLEATTGRRVWHFQIGHHGLWDYDLAAAPNLMDLTVGGRLVKAVAQATKQGFVYLFDRATGQPIFPIEERPVPPSTVPGERAAKTQPFPAVLPPFERQNFSSARATLIPRLWTS